MRLVKMLSLRYVGTSGTDAPVRSKPQLQLRRNDNRADTLNHGYFVKHDHRR